MRSRMGRRMAAVVAGKMTQAQAQAALTYLQSRPKPNIQEIQLPDQAGRTQVPQQPEAVSKLRQALHSLTPEQVRALPPDLAKASLEILGYQTNGSGGSALPPSLPAVPPPAQASASVSATPTTSAGLPS